VQVHRPIHGTGKKGRQRRVVYQYSFKRSKRDNKPINPQIARAEKIAEGKAPLARTRFLRVTDATQQLDWATIDRARQLAASGCRRADAATARRRLGARHASIPGSRR
jgi:hypothetical protein